MAFDGINTYLSAALADVLAPTRAVLTMKAQEEQERRRTMLVGDGAAPIAITPAAASSALLATPSLYELLSHVAPLPAFKLLEIWSSAGLGGSASSAAAVADLRMGWQPSWRGCMDALQRFVPRDSDEAARPSCSLAYSVFAHGDSSADPLSDSFDTIVARMSKLLPAVRWNPHPLDLISTSLPRLTWRQQQATGSTSGNAASSSESTRSLAVCANRSRTAASLVPSVRKARLLLRARAYTHWYTRYGVELSEMHDAVDAVEEVVNDYALLGDMHA